jgi:hypothetical protein
VTWLLGVVVVAVIAGLAAWLVLSAVRRTVTRQETGLPPLPDCPPAGPPLLTYQARYLGTTFAPSTLRLVVDWQLGPRVLRSGFALDEETAPTWAARLRPLVAP